MRNTLTSLVMRNHSTSSQNTLQALLGAPFFLANFMKHLTVVYRVNDETAFAPELNRVMELFSEPGEKPWGVIAVSLDNEIRRKELIEDAIAQNDSLIIPAILEHNDIGNVRDIDEL